MNEREQILDIWRRIEAWLHENLPKALDNLRAPATETQLDELELILGMDLPEALRVFLSVHDGEEQNWSPGVFADYHWFLPCEQISVIWKQLAEIAAEYGDNEDNFDKWRAQVEDNIISINGPVKPLMGSKKWIPISDADGNTQRFLDFDPPEGGILGQVIDMDSEGCMHQVIAPSFLDFLNKYIDDLENGRYEIDEEGISTPSELVQNPTNWVMPDYLKQVCYEKFNSTMFSENPVVDDLPADQIVTIVGLMGSLMGGPETIFSLETSQGNNYTFLASSKLTKGYGSISVEQHARVKARRYTPDTESYFIDQVGSSPTDFVAVEYKMLRSKDND
jgi:cell wall assembly regulator SMI1